MQASMQVRRPFTSTRGSRRPTVVVRADKCLIVNTKGGGHAFIGLHLAKALLKKGHDVTIIQDGDEKKLKAKAPCSQYQELTRGRTGFAVTYASPTDPSSWPAANYDVVYDNNGKDLETCKPLIDHFRSSRSLKHYVFVASAGAYKADDVEPCHFEGDARKSSAGHVEVEKYLESSGLPYTVFQPLYIYGPHTAKDCEQWFMDRISRDRPVPIPVPGVQLTSLSHVEDVANMLASVPGNKQAVGQHYNLCSDRAITFVGICKAIAKSMGKEANIVLYDPEKVGTGKKGKAEGFPFRTVHFFANSDKAKRELGWQPRHTFNDDVDALVADYMKQGRHLGKVDFSLDDKILEAVGAKKPASSYSW